MQVYLNEGVDAKQAATLVKFLEKQLKENSAKKMQAFVINIKSAKEAKKLVKASGAEKVHVSYLAKGADDRAIKTHKINTGSDVKITALFYVGKRITEKLVNPDLSKPETLEKFAKAIASTLK